MASTSAVVVARGVTWSTGPRAVEICRPGGRTVLAENIRVDALGDDQPLAPFARRLVIGAIAMRFGRSRVPRR
ncbi:hypothetical protein [Nocardia sp. NPDC051750]|uniref:hypothetical protein n=1 Tax=Nocardia sp. NPDC051750 TaxID=3364325 RepID=UPI0037A6499F